MYVTQLKGIQCRCVGLLVVVMTLAAGLPLVAFAQIENAVGAFDTGNVHYRDGNYADAITAYQEAIEGGYASGALFYNLGNAYFRNDELGQAIRFYEKGTAIHSRKRTTPT